MTYVVRRGDTLSSIARRFNTTVEELLRLNPREDPDLYSLGKPCLYR
ncbi:MAG: LysM domain-containing protein [Christensenellales bacterium]